MPLLSFDRINQWVPLDFMLKTDKMKLPLHEFSFVKATAPYFALWDRKSGGNSIKIQVFQEFNSRFRVLARKGNAENRFGGIPLIVECRVV